ncbi:MAG: bifunctional UDP-N-acetylglucosamine diphosphorylase/glucosamine-1-phosphate N-acetyltransferase GlmU [Aggregatilineales bacterium]
MGSDPSAAFATVILAAGQGTRMKSTLPKVLHRVGGRPMILRAVETARELASTPPVVVIGHGAEHMRQVVGDLAQFVLQAEQLGTGHALMQAADTLKNGVDYVLVYYADMPLLTAPTLHTLLDAQTAHAGPITLLTFIAPDPRGFGRIVRRQDGAIAAIVEEREATPEQLTIRELNVGIYAFRAAWLWDHLSRLQPRGNGEYYLTDLVELAIAEGLSVQGIAVTDSDEVIGVNTRVHLSEAEAALYRRVNKRWMLDGVTLRDPATTYIDEQAIIGRDTVIEPNTHVRGMSVIGENCRIGPNSIIVDSKIGADCVVVASVIEGATLEDNVDIGPFGHLRSGAYLEHDVHMGNFGEVKNARLGAGTRMGHFSYVGDAEIGADVNLGAGIVTVNFDGLHKHKTMVGDHAFIGSDTMLIAPVTVETNGRTAAGAVVTHDVPSDQIAIGVPARLHPIKKPRSPDGSE